MKAAGAEFKVACRRCTSPLAGFVSGLGLVQEDKLLVLKITKQQRAFELVHEIWASLQFPHLALEH